MAITAEARTDIIALVVGMFDAAPGATYLSQFVNSVDAGATIDTLAADLTGTSAFKGIYPDLQTANEFATKFVSNIAPEAGAAAQAWAVTWIEAQLNGGMTKAEVIVASINALRATDEADANWGNAAAALNNKVEVAEWYSVDQLGNATDLSTLQNQISTVTSDDTTVTDITSGSAQSGETFTLTDGSDTLTGTAGNDTFNADTGTFNTFDVLDGAAGTDTLNITEEGAAIDVSALTSVEGIEVANLRSDDAVTANTTGWTGLTNLNVNAAEGAVALTASDTTAISVDTVEAGAANITTTGGSTVSVSNANSTGNTTVTGGDATTSITLTDVATTGHIELTDASTNTNTITSISMTNVTEGAGGLMGINDTDALTTLSLTNMTDNSLVVQGVTAGERTLTLNLNAFSDATVTDGEATGLVINSTGAGAGNDEDGDLVAAAAVVAAKAESVSIAVTDTDAALDLDVAAATALTVSGDAGLTITDTDIAALETVTVSGSAGVTVDLSSAAITSLNLSATSGDNTISDFDATTAEVAVTGGTGADDITVTGALDADGVVDLGEGDDTYTFTTAAAAGASVDAGAGNDTIAIDDGANLDANASTVYSNFETLEIAGGTGTYDMSELSGLTAVTVSGALTAADATTAITEAVAGTTIGLTVGAASTDETLSTVAGDATAENLSFALADATGDSDSLAVTVTAVDGDDDETAEGQVTASLAANDIESVSIASTVTGVDAADADADTDALEASDYTNTITLDADAAETLTLTGDAQVNVTTTAATAALTQVVATGNTAGVTVNVNANATTAVTFNGSDAADAYTGTNNGDTIQGNGGADTITLGTGADTVRYTSASDSQVTLTDTSNPADGAANEATGFDRLATFDSDSEDLIELSSALGLATGDARADILQKGAIAGGDDDLTDGGTGAAALEDFIGDGVDFFDTGLVDRAVAVADNGTDTFVFVDANNDGNFTQADDMMIVLSGVVALDVTDFTFG